MAIFRFEFCFKIQGTSTADGETLRFAALFRVEKGLDSAPVGMFAQLGRWCFLAPFVWVRIILSTHEQPDRRSGHIKIQPQRIHQIPAVTRRYFVGM